MIEARIVAEDPAAGWLPSTGEITGFEIDDRVRVDTGTRAGSVVSADYDSLLAKVIGYGRDRHEAAAMLAQALADADVTGVRTNVDTLVAILREPDFLAGRTPTSYLDRHPEVLTAVGPDGDERLALLLAAVLAAEAADRAAAAVWGFAPSGWRNVRTQGQRQIWIDERTGEHHPVEYVINRLVSFGALRTPKLHEIVDVRVGPFPAPTADGSLAPDERRRVAVRVIDRDDEHARARGRRTPPARDRATARRVVAHPEPRPGARCGDPPRGSPTTRPSSSAAGRSPRCRAP